MSPLMLLAMLVGLGLSLPVAVAIGLASLLGVAGSDHLPWLVVPQQLYAALDKYPLVAVPFFILAGNLMEAGGISARLVDLAKSLVGGVRGGLALACVLASMVFATLSGSSVATTFAVGAILIPALTRHGYPAPFAAALQAASAELGVIIPPSIPLILYAISTNTSTGELFLAGVGPGLFIGGGLMAYVWYYARRHGQGGQDSEGRLAFWPALRRAWLALLMPAIILGGIYGGVFTPTEAAAVAVVFALALGTLVYRQIDLPGLAAVLHRSVIATAAIMFIIANAGLFSFLLTRAGVPAALGDWLTQVLSDRVSFLLAVNLALFLIGMFIETSSSIVVLAPLLLPVAQTFGIDPVHFGVIMIVNLALGMITPPFGVNLFAASAIAGLPLERLLRPLLPLVAVVSLCLLILTFVPELSLALRNLVYR